MERAKVGYRRVRISSEPDAVRSVELGRLDRGDEVEILESHEGFLRVRTPDDITGWILRHTVVSTVNATERACVRVAAPQRAMCAGCRPPA